MINKPDELKCEHPLPWRYVELEPTEKIPHLRFEIFDAQGRRIHNEYAAKGKADQVRARIGMMVAAVNQHPRLVTAIETALKVESLGIAKQVLMKALNNAMAVQL